MDIERKLLKKASFEELVQKMNNDGKHIYAPVDKDDIVNYARISSLNEMATDYIVPVQSAKYVVFPKVETLFEMETSIEGIKLSDKDLDIISETVLIGSRPCDGAGMNILNEMFGGDLTDTIYFARLDKTTLISISCENSDSKCFCTSLGVSPSGTDGSDILLTKIENGDFFAEIITEKGKAIVSNYSRLFEDTPEVDKAKFVTDVPVDFKSDNIVGKVYSRFDDEIWLDQSLRCIGCGACAFVCPACACFDIQDVHDGHCGKRNRSWDSCGFDLFTLHASGHNPREVQSQRWRQRILHKFEYMPEQIKMMGCVGCGRCSRACSVDMNLKEHLVNLAKEN